MGADRRPAPDESRSPFPGPFTTWELEEVNAAVEHALQLGTISVDAVRHLVLCRIERRPLRLDMANRPLRHYKRRWVVERLFAWLQWFRRLVTRYEFHAENFLGMVRLGCMKIMLRCLGRVFIGPVLESRRAPSDCSQSRLILYWSQYGSIKGRFRQKISIRKPNTPVAASSMGDAFAADNFVNGHSKNLEIKPKGTGVHVLTIQANLLRNRQIVTAIHLRPAGDPWDESIDAMLFPEGDQVLLVKQSRTRPYDAQIAA
jgi:hypothetical protein